VQAWVVDTPGPIDGSPLRRVQRALPEPGPGEVRVRVTCCGVCRTDLHLAEGDLRPRRAAVTPGHEVVGRVEARGRGADRFAVGERVGVAWLGRTDGSCRFCRRGDENLCTDPRFTGWDLDGGYADALLVDERFAYRLPEHSPTTRPRRCSAPGSSATAPCGAPPSGRGAGSASTVSAAAPT
jgi:propanol-preferring alcohol dehydrogenase